MATIPEIREQILHEAARCPDLFLRAQMLEWERELHRRPPVRKAPRQCRTMTDDRTDAIRAYAIAHPKAGYFEMSKIFGVSVGRISESIRGKRS
jgi:hypothetical protein